MKAKARRGSAALAAALALAAPLGGCGGGGGGDATSSATTSTSSAGTATTAASEPKAASRASKPKPQAKASKPKPPRAPAPTDPDPLPNQGTKAPAPGVRTTKGGDNSIQTYGTESQSSERVEAAATAATYLDARAQGQWAAACSYLSASIRERLTELSASLKKGPEDCAAAMAALGSGVPGDTLRSAADIHVLSFRVEGEHGFLVYRDGSGKLYNIPMEPEGGEWKVAGLIGSELLP